MPNVLVACFGVTKDLHAIKTVTDMLLILSREDVQGDGGHEGGYREGRDLPAP